MQHKLKMPDQKLGVFNIGKGTTILFIWSINTKRSKVA